MICLRNKQLKLELRRSNTFFRRKKPTKKLKSIQRLKRIKTETKKHLRREKEKKTEKDNKSRDLGNKKA